MRVGKGRELDRDPPITVSNEACQELDDLRGQAQPGKDEHRARRSGRSGRGQGVRGFRHFSSLDP